MKIIGITGSMGSGKTTVAKIFKGLGAKVIDADKIANKLLLEKAIRDEIISIFGRGIVTGRTIDRRKLAATVFRKPKALKRLCGIIHPEVIKRILEASESAKAEAVIVDAPLLIESGFYRGMDSVIVVKADIARQISRCMRKGFSRDDVLMRIKKQMPFAKKAAYADFVIDNNGSIEKTKEQAFRIWSKIV